MAAPNQPITKYVELYDRLCEKMEEDEQQFAQEAEREIADGTAADKLQAFYVAHRTKWAFMHKMIDGMKTHKVSKATLAEIRAILGDELNPYL